MMGNVQGWDVTEWGFYANLKIFYIFFIVS